MILLLASLACPGPDTGGPADTDSTAPSDELTDPLSMPASPTLDPADFAAAETCAPCHPDQVAQWRTSNHAYAITDPVFQALVGVRQVMRDGREDRFCMMCHTAIGVRGGEVVPGFAFADLSPIAAEGVTCEACHKVASIERARNSGHVLDAAGGQRGPLDVVATGRHASVKTDLLGTSEFCGACHDIVEASGLPLERPYAEWLDSPAAADGRTCQDCHMPLWTGRAAVGSPERSDLRRHEWPGVDVPFADGFVDDVTAEVIAGRVGDLLADAATLDLLAPLTAPDHGYADLVVTVTNHVDGHALPTGSTFLRQLWLEVVVTDAAGDVVYESGTFDDNGDLKDAWSALDRYGDPDLVTFSSGFVSASGAPELFPWEARDHFSNAIPAGFARTVTYFVPTDAASGTLHAEVRLRLRPVAPYLLRALGLDAYLDDVRIWDLAEATVDVSVE